jgi:tRNA pseudouridine38-40 synthase
MRHMHDITVARSGPFIVLTVCANAFLHHMVRNIAGVLIAIGLGERPTDWSAEVLAAHDRTQGGVTAAPGGLYLAGIRYAASLELPSEPAWDGAAALAGPGA